VDAWGVGEAVLLDGAADRDDGGGESGVGEIDCRHGPNGKRGVIIKP
jgi:hypothetical protein